MLSRIILISTISFSTFAAAAQKPAPAKVDPKEAAKIQAAAIAKAAKAMELQYARKTTFAQSLLHARDLVQKQPGSRKDIAEAAGQLVRRDFPVQWDWALQDHGIDFHTWFERDADTTIEQEMIAKALDETGDKAPALRALLTQLVNTRTPANDTRWLDLYVKAAEARRAIRLAPLLAKWPKIVFTRHFNLGGSHYAYTEAQSDAQAERNYQPGGALCVLEMDGLYAKVRTLLETKDGVIRDPDVSFDGKHILFAWKKSDREDDYHLYEMDAATGKTRQITEGLGFADYEGQYLPSGDIIFNSTRVVQTVDCWWTEVSNLYTCNRDGKFMRRLTFDQVHDNYPTVTPDGRILYTRWEYNDRGQLYPQPLYQMFPDGTGQTEFYGNNSWFPTTIMHARGIPGTQKVLALASGHHSYQAGKLIVIDPARGRQEAQGVTLVAPVRETRAEKIDAYGQNGELFQYPYPMTQNQFLVTYAPYGWKAGGRRGDRHGTRFGVYFMDLDGKRELLAFDDSISSNQPVPLAARPIPFQRPSTVDYRKTDGTFYVQDVYIGPGLQGIPRGTIKKMRTIAIEFRAAGVGANGNGGPAGGALVSTPIGVRNTSWDVKVVLGDAKVYDDGSAFFKAPARTPVYFQMLDDKGRAVQTMRSWSTLQPGENASCIGCHEEKNATPIPRAIQTKALAAGAQTLDPFYGAPRGFSYQKEIQPILNQHCTSCHNDRSIKWDANKAKPSDPLNRAVAAKPVKAFSLLAEMNLDDKSKRFWSDSYLALTADGKINPWVNWISAQSIPPMIPPKIAGSTQSHLLNYLEAGHYGVKLTPEQYEKIACWIDLLAPFCGDYTEAAAWNDKDKEKYRKYLDKRLKMEKQEKKNIEEYLEQHRPPHGNRPAKISMTDHPSETSR